MTSTIGVSLFAIALGAILKFAVTANVAGIDIATVGVIMMLIGAVVLFVGVWMNLLDHEWPHRPR